MENLNNRHLTKSVLNLAWIHWVGEQALRHKALVLSGQAVVDADGLADISSENHSAEYASVTGPQPE